MCDVKSACEDRGIGYNREVLLVSQKRWNNEQGKKMNESKGTTDEEHEGSQTSTRRLTALVNKERQTDRQTGKRDRETGKGRKR